MIFRILIILITSSAFCNGQNTNSINYNLRDTYALVNDSNKVDALLDLCKKYYNINNDTALSIAKNTLKIANEIKYDKGIAKSLFFIGNTYYHFKNFIKAKDYYQQSLKISIAINDGFITAINYRHLGNLEHEQGHFEKGVELQKKGLAIHLKMQDTIYIAQCFLRISVFYRESMDIDSAHFYSKKTIALAKEINDVTFLARARRNLAIIYMVSADYANAKLYFDKALKTQKKHVSKRELAFTYSKYGLLLLKQKKYNAAIVLFQKSIVINKNIKLLKNLPVLYENLAQAQESIGKHKQALESYLKFLNLNDSLQFKEEQIILNQEQYQLDILKIKNQNLRLEEKVEKQLFSNITREFLTIILLIILIILIFLIFNSLRKKELLLLFTSKQKDIRKKQSEANLKNEQFQAINQITQNEELKKEQIAKELHDGLGGTLAAIKMNLMQLKEDVIMTKIIDEVGDVATTNRYISHDLNPPLLKSESFSIITEDYLSHIFNNTDIELTITMLPKGKINKLDLDVQLTLYRIIQELCSNVKRHSKATKVNFQLLAHSTDINLIIEDNGVGFNPSNTTLKKHKGLQLIKERLIIIDGELEIDSQKDDGCTIYVFIPTNNTSN